MSSSRGSIGRDLIRVVIAHQSVHGGKPVGLVPAPGEVLDRQALRGVRVVEGQRATRGLGAFCHAATKEESERRCTTELQEVTPAAAVELRTSSTHGTPPSGKNAASGRAFPPGALLSPLHVDGVKVEHCAGQSVDPGASGAWGSSGPTSGSSRTGAGGGGGGGGRVMRGFCRAPSIALASSASRP